ncbi:hypothetical protein Syun_029676 [Stephania yunnanensis]|uniref:Uncharacterized protein n=1 Tax=Stephania yunnanensis TaxID=152371 RepID=A0AAP0HJR2_9MAGN
MSSGLPVLPTPRKKHYTIKKVRFSDEVIFLEFTGNKSFALVLKVDTLDWMTSNLANADMNTIDNQGGGWHGFEAFLIKCKEDFHYVQHSKVNGRNLVAIVVKQSDHIQWRKVNNNVSSLLNRNVIVVPVADNRDISVETINFSFLQFAKIKLQGSVTGYIAEKLAINAGGISSEETESSFDNAASTERGSAQSINLAEYEMFHTQTLTVEKDNHHVNNHLLNLELTNDYSKVPIHATDAHSSSQSCVPQTPLDAINATGVSDFVVCSSHPNIGKGADKYIPSKGKGMNEVDTSKKMYEGKKEVGKGKGQEDYSSNGESREEAIDCWELKEEGRQVRNEGKKNRSGSIMLSGLQSEVVSRIHDFTLK